MARRRKNLSEKRNEEEKVCDGVDVLRQTIIDLLDFFFKETIREKKLIKI